VTRFAYKGRNERGNLVSGELEAASAEAAAGQLSNLGLIPVNVEETGEQKSSWDSFVERLQRRKVSLADLIMFCRQMYTITKAGIPLIRGVRGLAGSVQHPLMRETLNDVADVAGPSPKCI